MCDGLGRLARESRQLLNCPSNAIAMQGPGSDRQMQGTPFALCAAGTVHATGHNNARFISLVLPLAVHSILLPNTMKQSTSHVQPQTSRTSNNMTLITNSKCKTRTTARPQTCILRNTQLECTPLAWSTRPFSLTRTNLSVLRPSTCHACPLDPRMPPYHCASPFPCFAHPIWHGVAESVACPSRARI